MVGMPGWPDFGQVLTRFWPDFDKILIRFLEDVRKILRNAVVQYFWDEVIQFYNTFSILTLVNSSQNRGKPYITNPIS